MKKVLDEKGITLSILIVIIVAITIIGGSLVYLVVINANKDDKKTTINEPNYNANNNNNSINNQTNTNNNSSVKELRESKYPDIFGANGSKIYPPQSYIANNIISINPNKDERLFIMNARADVDVDSKFIYFIDDINEANVRVTPYDPQNLTLAQNVKGTNIYVDSRSTREDAHKDKYIALDVPNAKNYQYYIHISPTARSKVDYETCYEISKHIIVDKTRGEYTNDVSKMGSVFSKNDTKIAVENWILDYGNVMLTQWEVYKNGKNEIKYEIQTTDGYKEMKVTLPDYTSTKGKSRIEEVKEAVAKNTSTDYPEELIEMDVDGMKFYGYKQKTSTSSPAYFKQILVDVQYTDKAQRDAIIFSDFEKVSTEEELRNIITEQIANKVLFAK